MVLLRNNWLHRKGLSRSKIEGEFAHMTNNPGGVV